MRSAFVLLVWSGLAVAARGEAPSAARVNESAGAPIFPSSGTLWEEDAAISQGSMAVVA